MPGRPRISRLWWFAAPVLGLLTTAMVVIGAMPLPYVALSPGSARPVEPLVEVVVPEGSDVGDLDEPSEDLLFLTVTTKIEPPGIDVLLGLFDEKVQVEPSAPFLGTQTGDESRRLNLERMVDSQDKARKVALERLGYEVGTESVGVFIEDLDPTFPAAEVLQPGMTVVGADGTEVREREELVEVIETKAPGDVLELEVIPLGSEEAVTLEAELGERPGQPERAVLGVSIVDRIVYDFPIDIRFDTGRVGGPSAGLALTLAVLDRMTPGDLTGDERVALTGTIELDGSVGPVGGVVHKVEAAVREGATLMLVPAMEYEQAVERAAGRIEVREIASLDDALEALEEAGGDPLPPAPVG